MKKAILYSRVSTEDQKEFGYSLRDQNRRLLEYCDLNNFEPVSVNEEDYSAKNFNRPVIKQIQRQIESKELDADIFLCVRMDRFSRDLHETIHMIKWLQSYGIELVLLDNKYDLSTPENLIPYYLSMLLPEVENKRRSLNTKIGMRQAMREGRWVTTAPFGYDKVRINGCSTLKPNSDSQYCIDAFKIYCEGIHTADDVRKKLNDKHGKKVIKQTFLNMLRNPVYAGLIVIPEWNNEKTELITGLHKNIISRELFDRVKEILESRKRHYKRLNNVNKSNKYPLKGILKCPICKNKLTASTSKGNGGHYSYYHCSNSLCSKNGIRFSKKVTHEALHDHLKKYNFSEGLIKVLKGLLSKRLEVKANSLSKKNKEIENNISELESKLIRCQNLILDEKIEPEDFMEMKSRIKKQILHLESKKLTLKGSVMLKEGALIRLSNYLDHLSDLFRDLSSEGKSRMINALFSSGLIFDGSSFRTIGNESVGHHLLVFKHELSQKKYPIERQTGISKAWLPGLDSNQRPIG